MSTVKSKKYQVGTSSTSTDNFTIYQPSTPDGTLRIGVGNADSPTEVGQFNANGYKAASHPMLRVALNQSTSQSISNVTQTKIAFSVVDIDTISGYDTTNYKYTPGIAGYYRVHCTVHPTMASAAGHWLLTLRKNGVAYSQQYTQADSGNSSNGNASYHGIVYLDSDDYLEMFAYQKS